jgi:hypothetical protein
MKYSWAVLYNNHKKNQKITLSSTDTYPENFRSTEDEYTWKNNVDVYDCLLLAHCLLNRVWSSLSIDVGTVVCITQVMVIDHYFGGISDLVLIEQMPLFLKNSTLLGKYTEI